MHGKCDGNATDSALPCLPTGHAQGDHGSVARDAQALPDGSLLATLSVEGRFFSARPLNGSAVGSVDGLAVLAESERALRDAVTWMPGRVLVLAGEALTPRAIDSLLTSTTIEAFAGVVVLADPDADLGHLADASSRIPLVHVVHTVDQERVRRAVRISITVDTRPVVTPSPHQPRVDRRRRVAIPTPRGIPGTIDLRPHRRPAAEAGTGPGTGRD